MYMLRGLLATSHDVNILNMKNQGKAEKERATKALKQEPLGAAHFATPGEKNDTAASSSA